ncbi:MAG: efflux RND transporter periplasmic adaptor subunit, partial [Leptolyngbyaceae cyanobacterium bins.302]|nr:efflux RND transporter periplasmic adaptor subunit [Leptolyngbyaceae cyanobacterium bins.302]
SNSLSELKTAQSDVQVAQSRIGLSDAAYRTRLAQLGSSSNPDGTVTISAPISGTVADREATQGESAADPGKALMTIVDDSSVLAVANVFEKDLDQIRVGQSVRVTVKSLPNRIFNGRVTVVGSMIQGQSRSLPVKAELNNPDGALKPGMFSRMEIITDRTYAAALAVPKSAIVDANGKTLVFVQEQGGHQEDEQNHQEGEKENEPGHQEGESHSEEKGGEGQVYEPVEVTLGRSAGDLVEIKKGIQAGDRVVTQGTTLLYAQSLQGGKAKEGDEHSNEGGGEKAAAATSQSGMLPWWLMLPLAGAIAAGTFWLGRRSKPPVILRDPDFADPEYKKDSDYKSDSN